MTQLFLSYVREDSQKARSIAKVLEEAGHEVWWDRHITGGAQYAKEIEAALADAQMVVVLWSAGSVESAWVRDEAAAGRDTGRLVPVKLDGTEPPMGFRQYQSIDFSRRGARRREEAILELLRAIDASGSTSERTAPQRPARRAAPRLWIGLTALAVFSAAALLIWQMWSSRAEVPSVTVIASENSAAARTLAGDLFVKLGSLQSSRADGPQLVEPASASDVDYSFKVGGVGFDGEPHANVVLTDRLGTLLWSREFKQPGGNQADLRQQLAVSAAQVLGCATEALARDHSALKLTTLKLYLNGCADLSNLLAKDPRSVIPTFKAVTEQAPDFAGGWAKLLVAEREAFRESALADKALYRNLRAHIRSARQINPTMAEAYLAEEWMQSPRPILGWMKYGEEALAKNPDHAEALAMHSLGLTHVGRMREAVEHARRAMAIEPLSPSIRQDLIVALMESGSVEAAKNELRDAERLWPGATNMLQARALLEYRYGDPKEAMRIAQSGRLGYSLTPAQESFLRARMDPTAANVDRAVSQNRSDFAKGVGGFSTYVRTLAAFGRSHELMSALLTVDPGASPGVVVALFHPSFASVRRDPRFMRVAHRLGLVDYWRDSGHWPDFCSEPDLPYDCKAEAAKLS